MFARPQGEANLINTGGQGGPREGKSAQDQPVGVALGQPDVQGPGFVPQPLLDTQPLLPTPPPSQKQFAFQPQVPGAEDVRFLEPATKPQPRDRPPQFFRPRPNGPPSIGAEEVNFLDPIPPQQPQVSELKDQPPKFLTPRPNGPPPSSFDAEEVSFLNPTQSLQPQDSGPKDEPPKFFKVPSQPPVRDQLLVNAPLNAAVDGRPTELSPNPPQSLPENIPLGIPPPLGSPPNSPPSTGRGPQDVRQQPLSVRPQETSFPLGPGPGLRPTQEPREGPPQFFRPRPTGPGVPPGLNQGPDQSQTRFNLTLFNLPANLRSRNQLIIDPNKLLGGFQTNNPGNQNVEFQFLGNQQNLGVPPGPREPFAQNLPVPNADVQQGFGSNRPQGFGPNRDIPQNVGLNRATPQGFGPNRNIPQGFGPGSDVPQIFDPSSTIPSTFQSTHNIPPRQQLPVSGPPPDKTPKSIEPLGPVVGPAIPAVPGPQSLPRQEVDVLRPLGVGGNLEPLVVKSPKEVCKTTFVEECHNEYKMVCEETTIEREKHQCEVVVEDVCEEGITTEYEPACFQQIINHCDGVNNEISTYMMIFL